MQARAAPSASPGGSGAGWRAAAVGTSLQSPGAPGGAASRQRARGNGVSWLVVGFATVVLLLFLLGVTGVSLFLSQDYQQAALRSGAALNKGQPAPGSVPAAGASAAADLLDASGCCTGPSLLCEACRDKVSVRLVCLRRPDRAGCPALRGLALGGNGELVRARGGKIVDANRLTLSAWVRTSVGHKRTGTVAANRVSSCGLLAGDARVSQNGYALKVSESGRLSLTVGGDRFGCLSLSAAASVVPPDQWVHVGATVNDDAQDNGFSASLFANGQEVATFKGGPARPLPRFRSTLNVFTVGSSSDGLEPFVGLIANVQVYHGAFRSALIWPDLGTPPLMGAVPAVIAPFLLLHYNFSDGILAGDGLAAAGELNITDLSGSGRDAVAMSARHVRSHDVLLQDQREFALSSTAASTLATPRPSAAPTHKPTAIPSAAPSHKPTAAPSTRPTSARPTSTPLRVSARPESTPHPSMLIAVQHSTAAVGDVATNQLDSAAPPGAGGATEAALGATAATDAARAAATATARSPEGTVAGQGPEAAPNAPVPGTSAGADRVRERDRGEAAPAGMPLKGEAGRQGDLIAPPMPRAKAEMPKVEAEPHLQAGPPPMPEAKTEAAAADPAV
jgi:hypothetical protein